MYQSKVSTIFTFRRIFISASFERTVFVLHCAPLQHVRGKPVSDIQNHPSRQFHEHSRIKGKELGDSSVFDSIPSITHHLMLC